MATRTSVGTGAWSDAGTWDSGVPVDGDDVVIASGHTVTFDVDQSAFTTGVKITITGTLTHTTASGNYTMFIKTGASVVGAGTWNIGTSGTPIPFAAKHTITGAAGWYVDGNAGLTMTVFGAEPTYTYVKLSGGEAVGQTELSVDTDVTGDIWAAGDIVRIATYAATEERIIAAGGITSNAITVTEALSANKQANDYIVLITRNIKILGVGSLSNGLLYQFGANKLFIGGGMWYATATITLFRNSALSVSGGTFSLNQRFGSGLTLNLSGGVLVGCSQLVNSTVTMTGGTLIACVVPYNCPLNMSGGIITKAQYGWQASTNVTISGGTFSLCSAAISECTNVIVAGGTFTGNGTVFTSAFNNLLITGGTFTSNTTIGWTHGVSPVTITGGTFTGNTYGFTSSNLTASNVSIGTTTRGLTGTTGKLYNVTLDALTEHYNYTTILNYFLNCQSEDHDGNDGALKAWCKGGVVTSQTSVKPTGYTQAYTHALESATYPAFWTKQFSVEPGKTVGVEVQLRKDASMTYLPRVYLMASIGNPLIGVTPVDSFTMTDSTDTWETDTFTVANSTDYDQDYTLWFVAQNATGNAYSAYDITTEGGSGSGGAVSIQPISGRLGL